MSPYGTNMSLVFLFLIYNVESVQCSVQCVQRIKCKILVRVFVVLTNACHQTNILLILTIDTTMWQLSNKTFKHLKPLRTSRIQARLYLSNFICQSLAVAKSKLVAWLALQWLREKRYVWTLQTREREREREWERERERERERAELEVLHHFSRADYIAIYCLILPSASTRPPTRTVLLLTYQDYD